MRKFKLIKNYPDSMLEIGDELVFNDSQVVVTRQIDNFDYDYSLDNCIKYKEFWQEVIEEGYKILKLSLQRSVRPEIVDVSDSGEEYILSLLNCQGNSIHSVKRLSDGEIFTIGDKIFSSYSYFIHKISIIKNIPFIDGLKDISNPTGSRIHYRLANIKKANYLFTTEDNIDIFEGDITYYVFNDLVPFENSGSNSKWEVLGGFMQNHNTNKGNDYYKVFSTKKAAEEYILINKPCLSVNDVLRIGIAKPNQEDKTFIEQVKYLAKLKIWK